MSRLPGPYTALACQVAGEITDVTDCSWQRTHEERQVHRQAGLLLGRLHERGQVPEAEPYVSRITGRVAGHLDQVGELLASKQRALARDCVSRLAAHGPRIPAVASHGDFQPRNWLWDAASSQLGVIDWERAEPAGAICDLARLEYGPWDRRPDLREEFRAGYGRTLTAGEQEMLACYVVVDALSGLAWGMANGDDEVVNRAWRTFERSLDVPRARHRPISTEMRLALTDRTDAC